MKTRSTKRSREAAEEQPGETQQHAQAAEARPPKASRSRQRSAAATPSAASRQQEQQEKQQQDKPKKSAAAPARTTRHSKGKADTPPAAPKQGQQDKQDKQQPSAKRQRRPARGKAAAPASAPEPAQPSAPPRQEQHHPPPPPPAPPAPPAGSQPPPQPSTAADMSGRPPRDDEDDMAGDLNSTSALQGLLRKLGAGFDDMVGMGMASSSRFKAILSSLRQADDESAQVGALTELCEALSISSEDTLASFPIESSVPILVQCLSADHNPDMMLLAARALTFMADVLPVSCGAIVRHGAVPAFCQRLLTIEYIDLAEQSLQALEKLSHEHSQAVLHNGGLLAVLSYLDFFPTGVQRVAVTTAANMCRGLTPDSLDMVQEAVPMLTNLLQYQDAKIVDKACVSLGHIAEAFGNNESLLAALNSSGLVVQALQLIKVTPSGSASSQLSIGTYYGLVRLLATCAASSPLVAQQVIEGGVLDTIRTLLSTSSILPSSGGGSGGSSVSMLRTADQLFEVLSLLSHLMPAVPDSPRVMLEQLPPLQTEEEAAAAAARGEQGGQGGANRGGAAGRGSSSGASGNRAPSTASGSGIGASSSGTANVAGADSGSKERARYLQEHPDMLRAICAKLLPLLLQLFAATVMPQVRHQCLSTIIRMLAVAPGDLLEESMRDVPVSSFVASLLSSRDSTAVAYGLHAAELLVLKAPRMFHPHFLKEGVIHALQLLAARTLKEEKEGAGALKEKEAEGQQKEEKKKGGEHTQQQQQEEERGGGTGAGGGGGPTGEGGAAGGSGRGNRDSRDGEWKSATRSSSRLSNTRKGTTSPPQQQQPPQPPHQQPQQEGRGTAAAAGAGTGAGSGANTAAGPNAGGTGGTNNAGGAGAGGPHTDALTALRRARDSTAAALAAAERGASGAAGAAGGGAGGGAGAFSGSALAGSAGGISAGSASAAAAAAAAAAAGRSSAAPLRAALTKRARAFLAAHFSGGEGQQLTPQGIADLRELCDQLNKDPTALRRLFEVLSSDAATGNEQQQQQSSGTISVFELLHSGAVRALCHYLQALDVPEGAAREELLLERLRAFAELALSSEEARGPAGAQLAALIRKLQAALAFTEVFPVLCSRVASVPPPALNRYGSSASAALAASRFGGASRGGLGSSSGAAGSLSSGLAALSQPFKLRMCRHPSETGLRDYGANVVLIEPLANMTAIEDFLWPRVHRPNPPPGSGGLGGISSAAATAGAARTQRLGAGAPPPSTTNNNNTGNAPSAAAGRGAGSGAAGGGGGGGGSTGAAGEGGSGAAGEGSNRATGGAWGRPPPPMPPPSKAQAIPGSRRTTRSQSRDSQQQQPQQPQPPAPQRQGSRGGRSSRSSRVSFDTASNDNEEERLPHGGGGSGGSGGSEREGMAAEQRMLDAMVGGDAYGEGDEEDGMEEDEDGMPPGLSGLHRDSMYADEPGMDEDEDDYDEEMPEDDDDEQAMGLGSMPVHDLHVAEGSTPAGSMRAPSAAAAAPRTGAGASTGGSGGSAGTHTGGAATAADAGTGSRAAGANNAGAGGNASAGVGSTAGGAGGNGGGGRPNAWASGRDSSVAAAASDGDGAAGAGGSRGAGAGGSGSGSGAPPSAAQVLASAPPKLVFLVNDRPLPPSCTVFQALQHFGGSGASSSSGSGGGGAVGVERSGLDAEEEAEEEAIAAAAGQLRGGGGGLLGRRPWDGTHTLYYRTATPADVAASAEGTATPEASTSAAAAQRAACAHAAAAAAPGATMRRANAAAKAAAQAQAAGGGKGSKDGSKEGSKGTGVEKSAGSGTEKGSGGGSVGALAPLGTVVPLHEVTSASAAAGPLSASDACKEVVALLGLLEAVNRVGGRLCNAVRAEETAAAVGGASSRVMRGGSLVPASGSGCGLASGPGSEQQPPTYTGVPRDEFVSSKLASKLAQQLKDVLAICGGGLPPWCHQLVYGSRHLFPFEMRRRYFYSTAVGIGRALQHMHSLHAAELGGAAGGDREGREVRIGRLQRQKVRVSRKRILESAVKVMELYAKHKAVLELEYFGEVGTGLGPTLEFYTLLSHDLQRRSLNMWRHEDAERLDRAESAKPDPMDVDKPAAPTGEAPAASSAEHAQHRHEAAWHDSSPEYVNAPWGLFPLPLPPSQRTPDSKVLEHFKLLGRSLGKALQDSRLMDLPFNYTFYRALLGRPLDMYDVARFDPQLGSQLERLWAALMAHRHACSAAGVAPAGTSPATSTPAPPSNESQQQQQQPRYRRSGSGSKRRSSSSSGNSSGKDGEAREAAAASATAIATVGPVRIDGVAVDDLCLTFTLPGQPDYELIPNGADTLVDSANLGTWIDLVVDATLGSGVASQLSACAQGFNEVFSLSSLECFYEDEIETLLCGAGEHWTTQTLLEAIKFDHGYTSSSPVVLCFLEVLSELDLLDQRRFLRFVTGCPRLPPGGLAALQPRLTVVRKQPSGVDSAQQGTTPVGSFKESVPPGCGTILADGDLPSVMTCANYIKLPPYSSKAVMRDRLLFAVREGQGSFDLS